MGRTIYNIMHGSSDATQTTAPLAMQATGLPTLYPFLKRAHVLGLDQQFQGVNIMDTAPDDPDHLTLETSAIEAWLDNDTIQSVYGYSLDAGTRVILDLEGTSDVSPAKWGTYDYAHVPIIIKTAVINAKAVILDQCRAIRPDLLFSFYCTPEQNQFAHTLSHDSGYTDEILDQIEAAASPIVAASDFLNPQLYWKNKAWTGVEMAAFATAVIARTKAFYPTIPIIPIIGTGCYTYGDIPATIGGVSTTSPTFPWTQALVEQYSVAGADYRMFLDAFSAAGIDDLILYSDMFWMPWDPAAPWWLETLAWRTAAVTGTNTLFISTASGTLLVRC